MLRGDMRTKTLEKVDRRTKFSAVRFFDEINSEASARQFAWKMKLGEAGFACVCGESRYWQHEARAEIKQCSGCGKQHRLRAGTIFENSKIPILTWLRAIHFVMLDKRGISALQLQRHLSLGSYQTAWSMLLRIRRSLGLRDDQYQLSGKIEFDGAYFVNDPERLAQKHFSGNKKGAVLIAVEQKEWVDAKGNKKSKAGFAKVLITQSTKETKKEAEKFISKAIKPDSTIVTDGRFKDIRNYQTNSKAVSGNPQAVQEHLPWVHNFISNSKRWLMGTHHGRSSSKYLQHYLAEYTFRFNRRHDPDSLFSRALAACCEAKPLTLHALCR